MPPHPDDQNQSNDGWMFQDPYKQPSDEPAFSALYKSNCHCGRIEYQLSRDGPLDAKFCHCRMCQVLHGAPFQWAAIFHKADIRFSHGVKGLKFYSSGERVARHELPCKVSCAYCGTPIMDEGRNMILVFPGLISFKNEEERGRFAASCHMFYKDRVLDVKDKLTKWAGMPGESERVEIDR